MQKFEYGVGLLSPTPDGLGAEALLVLEGGLGQGLVCPRADLCMGHERVSQLQRELRGWGLRKALRLLFRAPLVSISPDKIN